MGTGPAWPPRCGGSAKASFDCVVIARICTPPTRPASRGDPPAPDTIVTPVSECRGCRAGLCSGARSAFARLNRVLAAQALAGALHAQNSATDETDEEGPGTKPSTSDSPSA